MRLRSGRVAPLCTQTANADAHKDEKHDDVERGNHEGAAIADAGVEHADRRDGARQHDKRHDDVAPGGRACLGHWFPPQKRSQL